MLHMISHGNFRNMWYGHPIFTVHRPGKIFVGHLYHFIVAAIKAGVEKLPVNEKPPTLIGQTELGSSNLERVSSIDYIFNTPASQAVKINPFDEYTWLFLEANLGDFESMVEAARSYVIPLYAWRDEKANLVLVGTDRQWVWYTRRSIQTWASTLVAAMASLANDNSNFVTYAYGHSTEEELKTESGLASWGFQLYSRADWQDLVISTIVGSDRRERLDTKESVGRPILNLCGITSHYKEGGSNYNNYPRY